MLEVKKHEQNGGEEVEFQETGIVPLWSLASLGPCRPIIVQESRQAHLDSLCTEDHRVQSKVTAVDGTLYYFMTCIVVDAYTRTVVSVVSLMMTR